MNTFILTVVFGLLLVEASAGVISGEVVSADGFPISDVDISQDGVAVTKTDLNGAYSFEVATE